MKPFSLDWWWEIHYAANKKARYYTIIDPSDPYAIKQTIRYVSIRDYIRKRIEARVAERVINIERYGEP